MTGPNPNDCEPVEAPRVPLEPQGHPELQALQAQEPWPGEKATGPGAVHSTQTPAPAHGSR